MDTDERHPLGSAPLPTGPDSFPESGPNALARVGPRAAAGLLGAVVLAVPLVVIVSVLLLASGFEPDESVDAFPPWVGAVWFVVVVAYETLLVAWRGQTLGKFALGIRVARLDNGRPPLWWQAAIRVALPAVIATIPHAVAQLAFLAVYFSSVFDTMGRGLHDKAAGTVVVTTR